MEDLFLYILDISLM